VAISGDQWRSVHLPIRIEVEEGRDVKDLSVAAAHRPLVRVHRVAAAVPSVDLDAHVLRPELLEIAQTRSTLRLQSQFFQSQLQSRVLSGVIVSAPAQGQARSHVADR
jgi:hypothetical protein